MFNFRLDWWLVIPGLLLSLVGLTLHYATIPQLASTQLFFLLLSWGVFLFLSMTDYTIFFTLARHLYALSLAFLASPFIFGLASRGAHRWLQIGTFSLQPSEIVKPLLLIFFATIAATPSSHRRLWLMLALLPPTVLVFFQPDLGTTLVILAGWATVFFTHLSPKSAVILLLLVVIFSLPLSYFFLQEYQRQRLITFLNPYHDPLGQGYHLLQSLIAVGSGQLWGRGLGHGSQSQLRFLPEFHTDFIFATLAEAFGFVGGLGVILLLLILIWRLYRISQLARQPVAAYFCIACAALLGFQTFINIGMNLGLAPVTGITLPFLSYGGSSLLSVGITLGLASSISTRLDKRGHTTQ